MDAKLAEALSEITTGIYVLTVSEGQLRHGMSSSWVTQVSGKPPLIMAAVDKRHFSHGIIERQGVFGLNVVGAEGKELEDYFLSAAARKPENLESFAYERGETGVPLLTLAMAVFECRVVGSYPAGDHTLFVASIVRGDSPSQSNLVASPPTFQAAPHPARKWLRLPLSKTTVPS